MPVFECIDCCILFCRECPECGRREPDPELLYRRDEQSDDPAEYTPDFDGIDAIDY